MRGGSVVCIDEKDCAPDDPDRREFLFASIAGSLFVTTSGVALGADAKPPTRVLDDPRITHGAVTFAHGGATIGGYLARPKARGRYPAVLVVAGNRITEEYIPNTCAALAVAGYVGLAPDIFHTVPDSARTPDELRKALEGHGDDDFLADLRSGAEYLKSHEAVRAGAPAILGFCSGGRLAMMYGARFRDVAAVVPYHPGKTTPAAIAGLKAPVQIHSGTADRHVPVADIRALERDLKTQGTPVEVYLYEGADHGFLAYTRPYYRPEDARLSWKRVVAFLGRHLKR
jgi:carboxymethylenebutenolidase